MSTAFTANLYADWQTISILAAALSVIVSTTLIMLSRLFGLRNLEQVAKTEFVYAVSTVLIVIMAVGVISLAEPRLGGGSNSLASCLYLASFGVDCSQYAVQFPQQTLIDWMKLYMEAPTLCVDKFLRFLNALAIPVDAMASLYMEIFMSEHASGFGLKWISERIVNTTNSLAFYMYAFFFLTHILNFVKYYAGFFFSIGVALRAFPPTRGAGAYLMAISFGLYFVFPLAYIIIATLSLPHVQSNLLEPVTSQQGSFEYTCALPAQEPKVDAFACGGADMGRMSELGNFLKANEALLTDMLTIHIDSLGRHLVYSICVFPLIAFTILFTFVLNTTTLFGGNIPEVGRGLIKLI